MSHSRWSSLFASSLFASSLLVSFLAFIAAVATCQTATAQTGENLLENGSFEEVVNEQAKGWYYPVKGRDGAQFSIDTENPLDGENCLLLDTTQAKSAQGFTALNHVIEAEPYRGKRLRFRAALKTAERDPANGQAQLWFRVDRENDESGAFDNMQYRPVKSDEWGYYEIVADVDKDAERIVLGMLVGGRAKAWIDDASIEIVDANTKTTTMKIGAARPNAAKAPQQPFFNAWLWLVGLVLGLLIFSNAKNSVLQRFALRFSIVYWLIYCFPQPLASLFSGVVNLLDRVGIEIDKSALMKIGEWTTSYQEFVEKIATWTANNVLGINGELVSAMRNGSGDTTMAYVKLFVGFAIAFAIASLWSLVVIKRKGNEKRHSLNEVQGDQAWLRDLLRTYLRWVLALTMLGYGLSKAGFITTQFAQGGGPNEWQLGRTYGDSSPMGLVWTFMAASPAYTFFAGMAEVIGGVLLIFRRTMTLGALFTFGVMLNVVMLNFCYDVPVKQYSFHLLMMALLIAMPDVQRLANVLFFNRPTISTELLRPPYCGPRSIWVYRVAKGLAVLMLFAIPIYSHVKNEIQYEAPEKVETEHLLINRGYRWINESPFHR